MYRYFCMLDSVDTLQDRRVVVNVRTVCNIPQALAEGIIKDAEDPDDLKKAMKQSSDYMDVVWCKQTNPDVFFTMHVETGDVCFPEETSIFRPKGRFYHNDSAAMLIREHEFSHDPVNAKRDLDKHMNLWCSDQVIVKDDVKVYQKRFEISNKETVPPARQEYYKRGPINWDIQVSKTVTDLINISTVSRKCELYVDYMEDWKCCQGALIKQSDQNRLESIDQIKDDWV